METIKLSLEEMEVVAGGGHSNLDTVVCGVSTAVWGLGALTVATGLGLALWLVGGAAAMYCTAQIHYN